MKERISTNYASLEFSSQEENVGLARVCAASFASRLEFTLSEVEEIRVAVSEAVSNCVVHAYPDTTEGPVRVTVWLCQEAFKVEIRDWGCGIKDVDKALQQDFAYGDRMGLGFMFMESFMDDLEVESTLDEGTVVTMVKKPAKSAQGTQEDRGMDSRDRARADEEKRRFEAKE